MHVGMRIILATIAFTALGTAAAQGASKDVRRILGALEILVSPAEARTYVFRQGDLLAIGAHAAAESTAARRGGRAAWQGGYGAYEECYPGYGCRIVGGGYYGRGAPYPAQIMLTGYDLALEPITHANLPTAAGPVSADSTKDHWRILFEQTGALATNPAPHISTAGLLAPLARIDPVTTAGIPGRPVEIVITRRSAHAITADVQKLLNRLGHGAGHPDGLVGRQTVAAIKRFQQARGIEATGRLTTSLIDALYLAADETLPPDGRLVARRDGKTVLDTSIRIDGADTALGAHVFLHSGEDGWKLVTLHREDAEFAADAFGFDPATKHAAVAGAALSRLHVAATDRAKLLALAVPGSTLALSDETVSAPARSPY
ncbi:MAG: peptidoglycan-binding protein [Pseudomonadota bacterium]|nr:peptidoglycan-binding protein [Pseudomonadota bacterium]